MAISRSQLLKELLPGLNALYGLEYKRYGEEHKELYTTEKSERSFEVSFRSTGVDAVLLLTPPPVNGWLALNRGTPSPP